MRIRNRNTGCSIVSDTGIWIRILEFLSMPDPVPELGFAIALEVKMLHFFLPFFQILIFRIL
jgi:hypothetical protein